MNSLKNITTKLAIFAFVAIAGGEFVSGQNAQNMTVKVTVKSKKFIGKPVIWDGKEMVLLRRDGRLTVLPVDSHDDYDKVADSFKPKSASSIRGQLVKEFGSKYQVSITQNFVVVHPPGDHSVWAQPFEHLYQRFQSYFSSRGISLDQPEFPMVAVVLRTRGEFDRFLKSYHDYDPGILGYYSPRSNRIITFDQNKGRSRDASWFFNADTIIHEATHQTAFNTGLHSRYAPVPRWISEGLAMMFEAPGVNNSNYFSSQKKRINRARLIQIKRFMKSGAHEGKLVKLVEGDHLFRSEPDLAYAMSWALTFYLAENRPQDYFNYLKKDSKREAFQNYTKTDRKRDFAKSFKLNLDELEARLERFVEGLEIPPQRTR